jgi:hypothetical protein
VIDEEGKEKDKDKVKDKDKDVEKEKEKELTEKSKEKEAKAAEKLRKKEDYIEALLLSILNKEHHSKMFKKVRSFCLTICVKFLLN